MTPDELAVAAAARRQALAAVESLCGAVRAHVISRKVTRAQVLLGQAHQEFGGVGRWPAQTDGDRQRIERVRQTLIATETMVLGATMRRPPPLAPAEDVAAVIAECLKVLRTRDGLQLDEIRIQDRAANTAMALLGQFEIRLAETSNASPESSNGPGPRSGK
jgi:hypothetical protein